MNILVVGGAGFLGTNLVHHWLRHEPADRVTVVDSLDPRLRSTDAGLQPVASSIRLIRADVRDRAVLEDLLPGQDVVFNCAGQTSHVLSLHEPEFDLELNCVLPLRLLEAARALNPDAVYCYASSSTVVGRADAAIYEETLERPLDIVSVHKLAAEHYHRVYHDVHGLRTTVLRFANLFGPYGKVFPEFGFINYFIGLAWAGEDVPVYGSGAQLRNVMYVDDAAAALHVVAFEERARGGVFFATHEEQHSVHAVAEKTVARLGRGRVVSVPWPDIRRRIEVHDVRASSRRLRDLVGWAPRYSLDEGLARTREVLAAG